MARDGADRYSRDVHAFGASSVVEHRFTAYEQLAMLVIFERAHG